MNRDKEKFRDGMLMLAATFGKTADKHLLAAYWIGLDGLSDQAVQRAFDRAVKECKFMPKPAELRELGGVLSTAAQAALAFEDVERALRVCGYYRSPDFEDACINATIRNLGGWLRVCELEPEEFDKWFRKDFERVYGYFLERGVGHEAGQPLIGFFEQHNALHGHRVVPPLMIESSLPKGVLAIRHEKHQQLLESGVPRIEFKRP